MTRDLFNREKIAGTALFFVAITGVTILFLIVAFLFNEAYPLFGQISPKEFFFKTDWQPSKEIYGAAGFIVTTLTITFCASVIAVPLGVSCALFLSEIAPKWAKKILRPLIELLAGIPSVVYGLFAYAVIVDFIKTAFSLPTGESILAASIILAIMILPVIISISQDAIESVPKIFKEGSYGLGATDWQTIRNIILPTAKPGIFASIILGMGRAIGETMAVVLVLGNVEGMPKSILKPAEALTSAILLEMGEASQGSPHYSALFSLGCILFVIVLTMSIISNRILRKSRIALK